MISSFQALDEAECAEDRAIHVWWWEDAPEWIREALSAPDPLMPSIRWVASVPYALWSHRDLGGVLCAGYRWHPARHVCFPPTHEDTILLAFAEVER